MKRRTSVVTIGVCALVALGAWATVRAQGNATGTITLAMANGACGKTLAGNADGSTMRAKRGNNIQWRVVNNCSGNATVALGDWGVKGGDPSSPFDTNGRGSCAAAAGKECAINLHIRSNATAATYSYSVSVNGVKKDPDLIIEG